MVVTSILPRHTSRLGGLGWRLLVGWVGLTCQSFFLTPRHGLYANGNSALHVISLIIHSIRLHRHRKEGGNSQAGVPFGPKPTVGTVQVPQGQQQQQQQQPVVYQQVPQQQFQQQFQQQPPVYQQPQQQVYQQQPATREKQVCSPQPQQPVPVPQGQFYQQQ